MGRLIDEDELLNEIEESALEVEKNMKGKRIGKTLAQGCLIGLACVKEAVKRQPTAYDPEKVVEQLEVEFEKYYGENWNKAPYLIRTIEIVKGGGLDG